MANVSQRAAIAALNGDLSAVHKMGEAFDRRRKLIVKLLNEIPGVICPTPTGAFYVYPSVKGVLGKEIRGKRPKTSAELAKHLSVNLGDKAPVAAVRKAVLELRGSKGMLWNTKDEIRSAGSFFINPILSKEIADKLPTDAPRWPQADGKVKTSAAWLMEHAGVTKGDKLAGAQISSKHVLALTNSGNATANDIVELAKMARAKVFEKFGIKLQTEVQLVGLDLN